MAGSLRINEHSLKRIDHDLRVGHPPVVVAESIGISYSQWRAWREKGNRAAAARDEGQEPEPNDAPYEEVARLITEALWEARSHAIGIVTTIIDDPEVDAATRGRLACWYLERTCPQAFGAARDRLFPEIDTTDETTNTDQSVDDARALINLYEERLARRAG
jgi:hypothetical protein